ncbi:unnamed protein product [Urochloa humidicola]
MDAIHDDMLELILLHLDSQVSLLRAASTGKRWRRIMAADIFLRLFGSLHMLPIIAGYYQSKYPDINSGNFSLDFLPENSNLLEHQGQQGNTPLLATWRSQ